jgi:murein L,D-transpeptidase YafK
MRFLRTTLTAALLGVAAAAAHAATGVKPVALSADPPLPHVQYVLVKKHERRLFLMNGDHVVRAFRIHLGLMPRGQKERAGDFRTPQGWYRLVWRDPHSEFFLSILISYPNKAERAFARAHGWQPGGEIMIHGLPNRLHAPLSYYLHSDWTDGCIAVSDADMMQIWMMTHDGMRIDIQP